MPPSPPNNSKVPFHGNSGYAVPPMMYPPTWGPGYAGPGYGDPGYGDPGYGGPGYGGPGYGGPVYGDPMVPSQKLPSPRSPGVHHSMQSGDPSTPPRKPKVCPTTTTRTDDKMSDKEEKLKLKKENERLRKELARQRDGERKKREKQREVAPSHTPATVKPRRDEQLLEEFKELFESVRVTHGGGLQRRGDGPSQLDLERHLRALLDDAAARRRQNTLSYLRPSNRESSLEQLLRACQLRSPLRDSRDLQHDLDEVKELLALISKHIANNPAHTSYDDDNPCEEPRYLNDIRSQHQHLNDGLGDPRDDFGYPDLTYSQGTPSTASSGQSSGNASSGRGYHRHRPGVRSETVWEEMTKKCPHPHFSRTPRPRQRDVPYAPIPSSIVEDEEQDSRTGRRSARPAFSPRPEYEKHRQGMRETAEERPRHRNDSPRVAGDGEEDGREPREYRYVRANLYDEAV